MAHRYHRAVNKGDPGAFPKRVQPHEQQHVDEYPRHELHEAVVRDRVGKLTPKETSYAVQVILLEIAVGAEMVAYENGHYLAPREPALAVPVPFAIASFRRQLEFFLSMSKFLSNSSIIQKIYVNLYKEYTSLKSSELEELPHFRVMTWQPS